MRSISISWKTAIAAVASVATLGAGAVVARAATTEDDFGQQVRQEVAACKASAARTDEHGIGQCVSAWVTAHNPSNEASEARTDKPEPSESPKPEPSETPEVEPSETPEADDSTDKARPHTSPTVRPVRPVAPEHESGHDD